MSSNKDPADYRSVSVSQFRRALVFGSLDKYQPAGALWKQIIIKTNVHSVFAVLKQKYRGNPRNVDSPRLLTIIAIATGYQPIVQVLLHKQELVFIVIAKQRIASHRSRSIPT